MRYLFVLAIVLLAGCGGGGSSVPIINIPGGSNNNTSIVGRWVGTFATSDFKDNGTLTLNVGSNNTVTGTLHSNVSGRSAAPVGNVTFQYVISTDYQWSGGSASPYSSELQSIIASNGHLTGKWHQFYTSLGANIETVALNVDLVRQ